MSNLYQRLCQTGELLPTDRIDHISSDRIPSDEVDVSSPYTSTVNERARETLSEGFNSKARKQTTCGGIVGSSVALTDENYSVVAPDSKATVSITRPQAAAADNDSQLSGSLARYTGDYTSVRNGDARSSVEPSEHSKLSESISDLRADAPIQPVGERTSSMLQVTEDWTECSEDSRAFDACIPTNLNLMDSITFDVASHVSFDEEASLDAEPAMEDEAFRGELWVDMNAKGRASRSPSSSKRNKYSKYRGMLQNPAATNSFPKEPRINPWNAAFEVNTTASPRVGRCNAASNYLEMTKKVDERIQAILTGDRNAMLELHQKLDHLKASTKSGSGVPFQVSTRNLPLVTATQTRTRPFLAINPAAV